MPGCRREEIGLYNASGNAFVTNAGTEESPSLRPADKSAVLVAKLWW